MVIDDRTEWLEADGLGGFASGTTSGVRSRRYHALLLTARTPPTGRCVLVNGFDAWLETSQATVALTTQHYAPGVDHPDGASRILSFTGEPWPTWEYLAGGARVRHEVFVEHGTGTTVLAWAVTEADGPVTLHVRPFLSGRDYHSMHHENDAFRFEPDVQDARVTFRPYDGLPVIALDSNGTYAHAPDWYRNFLYQFEAERGLDATEDLAAPGVFSWTLAPGEWAVLILSTEHGMSHDEHSSPMDVATRAEFIREREQQRRMSFATRLDRAADAYLVRRGRGRSIIAGYPWFTDWGRDTFIAVRGLCASPARVEIRRDILLEWADAVSEGMLPNRFPDIGEAPEFNSVDGSLWYVVAVGELLGAAGPDGMPIADAATRVALERAVLAIVRGYSAGTRFGIRMDDDALLAAGVPDQQLTWMDARVGDRVITPRIGKPVEVQALWLNALQVASTIDRGWRRFLARGLRSFATRFWSEPAGHLADVVDINHERGTRDDSFRPNQILAVGGLPLQLIRGARARRIVDSVEAKLVTPLGLRSLTPGANAYAPRYEGGPATRDATYHQGTVWPWLMGPFVDAWLRVRRDTAAARHEARRKFLQPLLEHLETAGLGHVSEIADAESPFTPRGCPFQAWSLGELLRIAARVDTRGEVTVRVGRHRRGERRASRCELV